MKNILIFIAFLSSTLVNAQGEYFSVSQPNEWSSSIHSQVERIGDDFMTLGIYQTSEFELGHYLQKYSAEGNYLSGITYEGDAVSNYSSAFKQKEGNFFFSGYKFNSEMYAPYAAKYNVEGELLFEFELPDYQNDSVLSNQFHVVDFSSISSDIFIVGRKDYNTDDDPWFEYSVVWLLKYTEFGELLWEKQFRISEEKNGLRINGIFELDNGDILLSGGVYTDWNQLLVRLDSEGNHLWTYEWGSEFNDWLPWIIQEENNEFVIAYQEGQSIINGASDQVVAKMRVMRFNADAQEVLWEVEYEEDLDRLLLWDMIKTSDGGYAILGTRRDYDDSFQLINIIKKIDSLGNELWHKEFVNPEYPDRNSRLYDIEETSNCGFILAGETIAGEDTEQVQSSWLVKLDRCGEFEFNGCMPCTNDLEEVDFSLEELKVYPNPVNSAQDVLIEYPAKFYQNSTLSLSNSLGQEVYRQSINTVKVELRTRDLSSGIYMITLLSAEGERLMKRMVVE